MQDYSFITGNKSKKNMIKNVDLIIKHFKQSNNIFISKTILQMKLLQ